MRGLVILKSGLWRSIRVEERDDSVISLVACVLLKRHIVQTAFKKKKIF